jgi:hypothetical protein
MTRRTDFITLSEFCRLSKMLKLHFGDVVRRSRLMQKLLLSL